MTRRLHDDDLQALKRLISNITVTKRRIDGTLHDLAEDLAALRQDVNYLTREQAALNDFARTFRRLPRHK